MSMGVFIPGRLKSQRLANKLILPLGTSNLWDIACRKLASLPSTYNKYALCWDPVLIETARRYPEIQVIVRDSGTVERDGPLTYIFQDLAQVPDQHLMFLNPCLSLLRKETIQQALETFQASGHDYATSVKEYRNWLWREDGTCITPIDYVTLSTKTIPVHYEAAHCFHIFPRERFFQDGHMLAPGLLRIPVPRDQLADVDDEYDLSYARFLHSGTDHA